MAYAVVLIDRDPGCGAGIMDIQISQSDSLHDGIEMMIEMVDEHFALDISDQHDKLLGSWDYWQEDGDWVIDMHHIP